MPPSPQLSWIEVAMAHTNISERFNAADADVVIKSSDNILFRVHREYLKGNTGSFPPVGIQAEGEALQLTEDSATLELLFQFIYPRRHPTLYDSPYEVIAPLSDAAEKYEVFSAINICQIRMLNFLPAHAEGIMAYAAKNGYTEVVDSTAPLLITLPIGEVVRLLPQHLVVPWIIYRQQWQDILLFAVTSQPTIEIARRAKCVPCKRQQLLYCDNCGNTKPISGLGGERLNLDLDMSSLSSLDTLVKEATEKDPGLDISSWQKSVQAKIDGIQKLSVFL